MKGEETMRTMDAMNAMDAMDAMDRESAADCGHKPDTILETRSLVKRFGAFLANEGISLSIRRGEIHAILGENGAGKSTLMNMLCGMLVPDEGEIRFRGRPVRFTSPGQAMEAGIGMVHQHFMLIPALTVTENVALGMKGRSPLFRLKEACAEIRRLSERFGLEVEPERLLGDLSVGQQQRVEIVKTLYRGAEFIVLDEPTAVLTPPEVQDLFRVLSALKAQGKTIIFISHKLQEVQAICDRVTVLRLGRLAGTLEMKDTNPAEIARLMIGRDVRAPVRTGAASGTAVRLRVEGICASERGVPLLRDLSLRIREGEILGIAGVDGNGQRELAEVLFGLRGRDAGEIRLEGRELDRPHPRLMTELGAAYIPEDRHKEGLMLQMSIAENLIAKQYRGKRFSLGGFLRRRRMRACAEESIRDFAVRATGPGHRVGGLSGGNQQKVILARELMLHPRVMVAMQPTRGMDVGAAEYVHRRLLEAREQGCAILLISTELEEIMALSDRIAVIYKGRLLETMDREEADLDRIGLLMAGVESGA
ncbi:ABC-type sugar (aldose) transport system, ATPase component [Paenibacillus mucilaginosus KNP414]|uniref:ABC-type sugar (Aldose) transport system, ATPase component n=2 Tax=Paenibacillus mucilaginosus TaxID=61624 RepID=F8F4M6_PAEMK|nr:ABC-type sugar (aldose) transport system, ATPase component [Paenibacillus mucilaginosus KNP414]